jgi:hypothetical protein
MSIFFIYADLAKIIGVSINSDEWRKYIYKYIVYIYIYDYDSTSKNTGHNYNINIRCNNLNN